MYMGGSFFPVSETSVLGIIANFTPNFHIFKIYETLVLGIGFGQQAWRFAVILSASAVLAFPGWLLFMKKEVN
jgi:hypothetical protein